MSPSVALYVCSRLFSFSKISSSWWHKLWVCAVSRSFHMLASSAAEYRIENAIFKYLFLFAFSIANTRQGVLLQSAQQHRDKLKKKSHFQIWWALTTDVWLSAMVPHTDCCLWLFSVPEERSQTRECWAPFFFYIEMKCKFVKKHTHTHTARGRQINCMWRRKLCVLL